jgi:putative chitinase
VPRPRPKPKRPPAIVPAALRFVVPSLTPLQAGLIAPGLALAMRRYGITTPVRAAMFVAQCAHESDAFRTSTEYASGADYEGRQDLGNTRPGDGRRFKGRGRIMITGRANYTRVSTAFGQNFVAFPERLAKPPWSELASGWWWSGHGLNEICDRYKGDDRVRACTRRINGGYNGLEDRRRYARRAMIVKRLLVPR